MTPGPLWFAEEATETGVLAAWDFFPLLRMTTRSVENMTVTAVDVVCLGDEPDLDLDLDSYGLRSYTEDGQ